MANLVSVSGFAGSGKDTIADYLIQNHNFKRLSFAGTLKDAVSAVFGWDRLLVEGSTSESRQWREQVDHWWATRLNIPHLTPRWVLQYWGTEVLRTGFHDDIWIASLENLILKELDNNQSIVISDARFVNELLMLKNLGGFSIRVKRGSEPSWYQHALSLNTGYAKTMPPELENVHISERAWIGYGFDYFLENNSTLEDLHRNVDTILNVRG
jgi:hypothetical protein